MTKTESRGLTAGLLRAARGLITPPVELLPDLRALRDESFGGVLDDIYRARHRGRRRSEQGADQSPSNWTRPPIRPRIWRCCQSAPGIPQENILYFSIHNHTSPVTG